MDNQDGRKTMRKGRRNRGEKKTKRKGRRHLSRERHRQDYWGTLKKYKEDHWGTHTQKAHTQKDKDKEYEIQLN